MTSASNGKAVLITAVIIAVILMLAMTGCVQEKYSYMEIYGTYVGEVSEESEGGEKAIKHYELKLYLDGRYEAKEEDGNGENTKEYGSFRINPIALENYRITLKSEVRVSGDGRAEEKKDSILKSSGFRHDLLGEVYALENDDGIKLEKAEEDAEETMEANVLLGAFGGTIDENKIGITVEESVSSVKVGDYLYFSEGSEWELYYDDEKTEKSLSKTAALKRGLTELYVSVGTPVDWYEVDFYREYRSPVEFRSEGNKVGETSVKSNERIPADAVPAVEREGYGLVGWADEEGRIWNFAEEEPTVGDGYRTYVFTAVWEANRYTAVLKDGDKDAVRVEVEYNKEYRFPETEKEGHTFLGWSDGEELVTDASGEGLGVWNYSEDKEFTAAWRKNVYDVTVESETEGGGEYTGAGEYEFGATAEITVKTLNGYTFAGWFRGEEKITDKKTVSVEIGAADITLSAKFEEYFAEIYVNRTDGNVDYKRVRAEAGVEFTAETPNVSDCQWDGWYDENGEKVCETAQYTFEMPARNVTVEARWTAETVSAAEELLEKIKNGETIELDGDVDMSGTEWKITEPYYGEIKGNGYALKNVTISGAYYENNVAYVGLFPMFAGTVENLKFENVTVSAEVGSAAYIGLFAGKICASGQTDKIEIDGSLKIKTSSELTCIGGFAGSCEGRVTDCAASAEIAIEAVSENAGEVYAAGFVAEVCAYALLSGNTASGNCLVNKNQTVTINVAGFAALEDENAFLDGNSSDFSFPAIKTL